MINKTFPIALFLCFSVNLFAQDSSKAPFLKITGSADIYYRYSLENPNTPPYNNFTSFTNSQNSFELGMVSVKLEHQSEKSRLVADLGFGKRAIEYSYNDSGSLVAIKQLFFSYAPSSKIKLVIGTWSTHIGYESLDPFLNRNYSMSYLFSYGPFFHTGLKAEFSLTGNSTLMVGIADPSDLKQATNLPKMVIGQLASTSKDEKLKIFLNYQGGRNNDSNRLFQLDGVVCFNFSEKFSLGYNGSIQWRQKNLVGKWNKPHSWWGSALYINSDPLKWLGFTLRTEYFNGNDLIGGFNTKVIETTLSPNFKVDNLTLIPEFRFENASDKIYANSKGYINRTSTFLVAAVYKF